MGLPLKHLLAAIERGDYDHRLMGVVEKVQAVTYHRSLILSLEAASTLSKGDLVRIKMGKAVKGRPRFLGGRIGTVIGIHADMVTIKLEKPCHRRSGTIRVTDVPALYVEKL